MIPSATKPRWHLHLTTDERTETVQVEVETISIGKLPGSTIVLDDVSVSREHCRLYLKYDIEAAGVVVEDLGSTNGIFFHGERRPQILLQLPSDSFSIGSRYSLRVDAVETPHELFTTATALQILDRLHRDFLERLSVDELNSEERILAALELYLTELHPKLPIWIDRRQLRRQLTDALIGMGPLHPHFIDPQVSEIMVNGTDNVFVIKHGRIQRVATRFFNNASLLHCIRRMITPIGRSIDELSPTVDARLPGKGRLHAIIPPLSLTGPCLTIRKNTSGHLVLADLVSRGALSNNAMRLLELAVQQQRNLVICGGTDTGKTTLLNLLSQLIPPTDRIITIEDTAELSLQQPHVITLESRPANLEGKGEVTIRDLLRNALRMRPDRLLIGECRGGEALDMLQAMNTGHEGCMTTLHANSARESLSRLETLCLLAGLDLPVRAIREQLASGIHLIVSLVRQNNGTRLISSILEVVGLEEGTITTHELFRRDSRGDLQATGIVPKFLLGATHVEGLFNPADTTADR